LIFSEECLKHSLTWRQLPSSKKTMPDR
jgi:hypothetical protein